MARDRFSSQSLGVLPKTMKRSRVLLVGAGGIGCELLKNLTLTGFGEIHIVDLDTIDLSNLNRQFLFRHEHIKNSKALVAKDSAARFNPHVKLEAHHANIKDPQFTFSWFKSFQLVFNALDNLDARRYVNKMCLLAEVPLIESGTTGFDGQVQVIKKGQTECYDCNPKPTPKSFPVCTIRSTPSQPIHCIVWAKSYLFTEIFAVSETEGNEMDASADSENIEELKALQEEAQALKRIRESMGSTDFPELVFEKVFDHDISRLRSMEDMWKSRQPPTVLNFDEISGNSESISPTIANNDQSIWSLTENFAVFSDSLKRLSKRYQEAQAAQTDEASPAVLSFDKDDDDALDFVAAAANLRSIIFGINPSSKFKIKQMAGNIIPAIATTNAMTAGLCVLQAFKIMRDQLPKAKMVFLERSNARVINSEPLKPPNPTCEICAVAQSDLVIDPSRAKLNDLVNDVLKLKLGYGDDLSISNDAGLLYDPDYGANLEKKLTDLGVKSGTFLTVMDEEDESPRVNVSLAIAEQPLPADSKPVLLQGSLEVPRKPKKMEPMSNGDTQANGDVKKRKRSSSDLQEQSPKKGKMDGMSKAASDEAIPVESAGDGAIIIGDD